MMRLFEQWQPRDWSDIVGQDRALRVIDSIRRNGGLAGNAFYMVGPSGTGKSAIANLIAWEVAELTNITPLDAGTLTPAQIQDWERKSWTRGGLFDSTKTGRVFLVNEAHSLSKPAQAQFLLTLDTDQIPPHVCWIFTTSDAGQQKMLDCIDRDPLVSRCVEIPMARFGLAEAFAKRLKALAMDAQLDGRPIEDYVQLLKECKSNFRRAIERVASGAMLPPEPNPAYQAEVAECVGQLLGR